VTKIKIDEELIKDIIEIHASFNQKLRRYTTGISEDEIFRGAGYLTIAYMFGAERIKRHEIKVETKEEEK